MRLGRRAIKRDSRTLRLGRYFTADLPAPPPSVDWTKGITNFGMLGNDTLGDCTCAGVAHLVQLWTANTASMAQIADADVLGIYEKWCGYNPGDPSTDQGGIELDILNDWKATPFAGHELMAFADPSTGTIYELQQAINLFGGLYIGLNVPNSVMQISNDPTQVWDVVADDGGIDGGHCVVISGYDATGFSLISWGAVYRMTTAFWHRYVDEAHALLSPDWIAATGAPSGFDLAQLQTDLAAIH